MEGNVKQCKKSMVSHLQIDRSILTVIKAEMNERASSGYRFGSGDMVPFIDVKGEWVVDVWVISQD
jgi:hypothetical protein